MLVATERPWPSRVMVIACLGALLCLSRGLQRSVLAAPPAGVVLGAKDDASSDDKPAKGKATAAKKGVVGTNPFRKRVDLPDLPKGLEWFNTKKSLTKADLKGKFVLFDFWTYCCINCMHILPELKKLERKYPNQLVVIGVHSAKFETEKGSENIVQAMLRDDVEHLVVNDGDHQIWNFYGISVWPTLLLVDPEGMLVYRSSGEFKAADVGRMLDRAIPYFRDRGLLDEKPFPIDVVKSANTPLLFPGKVLADEASNRLYISDSNHNRIVVTTLAGELIETIGSGAMGREDGDFARATFDHPQGCALHQEMLYVADTDNHLIRRVDLKAKIVKTIAGTGMQADSTQSRIKRGTAKGTPLSSPWDLCIHKNDLYIAMAGSHQIWKMGLAEAEIGPYAGNGVEDIVDGRLLPKIPTQTGYSSFAQPSGLSSDGEFLYVADSEGSSIRAVPFDPSKEVRTIVGTANHPEGRLFDFGDSDGPAGVAKFQHCIGVVVAEGRLYVADTYNNKVRQLDLHTVAVTTLAGKSFREPGHDDAAGTFDEPAGVAYAKGKIYVADTNNHLIRTIDLDTGKVGTLAIAGLAPPAPSKVETKPSFAGAAEHKFKVANVKAVQNSIKLHVSLNLPSGWEISEEAPMNYWLDSPHASGPLDRAAFGKQKIDRPQAEFDIAVPVKGEGKDELTVSLVYNYCQHGAASGVCSTGGVVYKIPLSIEADGRAEAIQLRHTIFGP